MCKRMYNLFTLAFCFLVFSLTPFFWCSPPKDQKEEHMQTMSLSTSAWKVGCVFSC